MRRRRIIPRSRFEYRRKSVARPIRIPDRGPLTFRVARELLHGRFTLTLDDPAAYRGFASTPQLY